MIKIFIKKVFAIILIFAVSASVSAQTVAVYTSLGIPAGIDTSFKTYMDWRCITNKSSAQYKYIRNHAWIDSNGFMRANADRDAGINDDYYLIALGSYYGTTIGTKYRITTNSGNVFYGVLGDQKSDKHTNSTCQYAQNRDVVEMIVNTRSLHKKVKKMGSADVFGPLRGSIASIERIDFVNIPDPEPEETEEAIETSPYMQISRSGVWHGINRNTYENNRKDLLKWIRPLQKNM